MEVQMNNREKRFVVTLILVGMYVLLKEYTRIFVLGGFMVPLAPMVVFSLISALTTLSAGIVITRLHTT